jgi:hypothetical protein
MSEYNHKADLFLEPKTTQYGSHMIMTNVNKQTKTKYINIDTKFRDEYNYLQISNYNMTLPERITDVKSIEITNVEIPVSYYNISANLGNNYFKIINIANTSSQVITIPDGQYTGTTLASAINTLIAGSLFTNLQYLFDGSRSIFKTASSSLKLEFDIDSTGNNDKFNFKYKLGWLLGFRNTIYTITTANTLSEAIVDLNGPRYLYLAIDEFNSKGNQNSFITPLSSSMINKKVISRIAINSSALFSYGHVASLNRWNGLTSDVRSYTGAIDLLKLNVQLLNENGIPMQLNGLEFSFVLKVKHE